MPVSLWHFYYGMCVKLAQLCPTLCDPMDHSPPISSVHWILQARILKWVAMPSTRGSSQSRDQTCTSCVSCIEDRFFTTGAPREAKNNAHLGEGNGTPLQYSCLENPMDGGAW